MSLGYRAWTSRRGHRGSRPTVLYNVWRNMRARCKGRATKCPHLYEGLQVAWNTFDEFRAWAIENGFRKGNTSPDRKDTLRGYTPDNVRFVPKRDNALRALYGDDAVRGPEPPLDDPMF